ncbi:MAG TPA: HU family DNA-binding protein [bacterium]|nr:HU family DNA-binding protein [bacterium]
MLGKRRFCQSTSPPYCGGGESSKQPNDRSVAIGGSMTKAEFIQKVSKKTKLSKAQTARILDATLGEVQGLLKKGDAIAFTGFGTFSVSRRKARKGRHPRTGAPMSIPATKVPRFRPGKFLKDAVK